MNSLESKVDITTSPQLGTAEGMNSLVSRVDITTSPQLGTAEGMNSLVSRVDITTGPQLGRAQVLRGWITEPVPGIADEKKEEISRGVRWHASPPPPPNILKVETKNLCNLRHSGGKFEEFEEI